MSVSMKSPRSTARVVPGSHAASADRHVEARRARRRMIDPTTCERDYAADELEFMQAIDRYKRATGRMFPTCSEVLEVVRSLGYQRATTG
ncbi:MAG: hypothetical protein ACKO4T_13745 [Planctomycetaceae bacterium]